ncbi:Hypothetical protein A7982_04364 [Minicystis rosea]|nr:Hypothetical protein A7982_04364 [Minicystis rosea]
MKAALVPLLCVVLSACSRPAPSDAAATATPDAAATATPGPAGNAYDPVKQSGLGGPCPPDAAVYPFLNRFCDTAGRVSGVIMPVDVLEGVPPAGAEILATDSEPGHPIKREYVVALDARGTRLWVRAVTCGDCRRMLGWSFVGDLARLEPGDLQTVQGRLGLPRDPVLKTADAWRKAVAAKKINLMSPGGQGN